MSHRERCEFVWKLQTLSVHGTLLSDWFQEKQRSTKFFPVKRSESHLPSGTGQPPSADHPPTCHPSHPVLRRVARHLNISLQATCQIFVDRLAPFRQPISHSHSDSIHGHLIYPTDNTSLLSLIFTSLHPLVIIMSYDHSKFVSELNEFDCSKIRESRNLNLWICLFSH
jgi:hypothetical protein